MSDSAREVLERFEALSEAERNAVTLELLRRHGPFSPDISSAGFDELADTLFATLDAEEAAHGRR